MACAAKPLRGEITIDPTHPGLALSPKASAMIIFRVVWAIAVIVALLGVAFFFIGIADGTVSSFNIVLWAAVLAGLAVVVFGSRALSKRGQVAAAAVLAAVLAVPGVLYALFLLAAVNRQRERAGVQTFRRPCAPPLAPRRFRASRSASHRESLGLRYASRS